MITEDQITIYRPYADDQAAARDGILRRLHSSPIPGDELLDNLGLYLSRNATGRLLFLHHLYQQIVDVHGAILVFGVRWGRDLAMLQTLRALLEPANPTRSIIGFDTFTGFPGVTDKDGDAGIGDYTVTAGYRTQLRGLLHDRDVELENRYPRLELVQGDVTETLPRWLDEHREVTVAMAYLDLDLYAPTKVCLELLRDRLTRGSIVALDEIGHPLFPGEADALRETWGSANVRLRRTRFSGHPCYFVVD